ncbi:branched-chain amino acid ABC transporter permease [Oleomonas cavernae]|nr:branched-chain amino acid ABC transporter permease [Oleomonas cavernae]
MTSRPQLIFLLVTFLVLLLLPLAGSRYLVDLASQIMIFSLFALSLNVLAGHIGSISFGHAAFFAIGGYACAYLLTTAGWPLAASMAGAVVLTAVSALLIGLVCVRLNAIYFSMLTLAFSMLVWAVAVKWKAVTGGDDGFVGVTLPQFLTDPVGFFWFTLGVTSLSVAALWILSRSAMGRTFIAIRENPVRAGFLGLHVRRMQLVAFVIAGVFAGVAGCLLAIYVRGMYPQTAFWTQSGQVVIMVLLGGVHSFVGPILGATLLYLLEMTIHQYTEYWPIVLGIILMVIVLAAPEGIVGLFQRLRRRLRRPTTP